MESLTALATHIGHLEILTRLGVAAVIGFAVGLERELKSKNLGLRTNMLVAIGAAAFGIVGAELVARYEEAAHGTLQFDPARIVEGIITGIGFLGAGAIIQGRGDIHGGTTAAAVWVLGGVGLACGLGLYALAVYTGTLLLFVLAVLGMFTGGSAVTPPKHKEGGPPPPPPSETRRSAPARAAQSATRVQNASPGLPSA